MTLLDYALVSLEDVKSFLGITTTTHDTLLTMIINMVTEQIETRCDRRFDDTEYEDQVYSGIGVKTLILKEFPVTDTTTFKLERNNSYNNSDNWEEIDADTYWVEEETGIITKTTVFHRGTQNWRVTYSAGFTVIPYDIQLLAMSVISEVFNKRNVAGVKSEKLGDRTVSFEAGSVIDNNQSFLSTLSNYRKIPV